MSADPSHRRNEYAIVYLYRAALSCFPEAYRREYADELLYALHMAAAEAVSQGRLSLLRLAWRELRDLPYAILRAHLHERKGLMNLIPGSYLPGGPLRGWRLGAVFLPFMLLFLFPLRALAFKNTIPWLIPVLGLPFLGSLVAVWVVGLVRKFPVWALPALGMGLFFVSTLLGLLVLPILYYTVMGPLYGGWPEQLSLKIGMMLLIQLGVLLVMVGAMAGLLRILPGFHARVRQEWTLLSFLLYGIAIVPVLIGSDEFHGTEWYQIAASLVLVVGTGLYLEAPRRWQRVLALLVPVVLSAAVMSLGLYQVFPAQPWVNPTNNPYRVWEALQPLLSLAYLPILMLLAALVPRLPWNDRQEPSLSKGEAFG